MGNRFFEFKDRDGYPFRIAQTDTHIVITPITGTPFSRTFSASAARCIANKLIELANDLDRKLSGDL